MSQTTIQNPEAIRKGSIRVLVGDAFDSLVDVGALRNAVFTSLVETQTIEFDNVDPLKKFVKGKRVQVAFDLAEINLENISELNGGLFTLSTVAGSPVAVEDEALGTGWTQGQPIKLDHKDGDNTVVGSIVINADGTPLTLNTNYRVYVGDGSNGELGATYIVPITTSSAVLTADYSYTPNASKKLTFAESGNSVLKKMRIINEDADGKQFRMDIEDGTNITPVSIDFAGDAEDDVAVLPVTFEGNLVEWVDEQNA